MKKAFFILFLVLALCACEDGGSSDPDPRLLLTIYEGVGTDEIQIGDTESEVLALLGEPDETTEYPPNTMLNYKPSYCIDFLINGSSTVIEFRFNEGYLGSTDHGISIGTAMDVTMTEHGISGQAPTIVDTSAASTDDLTLYEVQDGGVTTAYKFRDRNRGILYWFTTGQAVHQIVVYNPY